MNKHTVQGINHVVEAFDLMNEGFVMNMAGGIPCHHFFVEEVIMLTIAWMVVKTGLTASEATTDTSCHDSGINLSQII